MKPLVPQELRDYAGRDWGAPQRLARQERARQPIDRKVAIAVALYEAARAARPGWPDEATRRADLDVHLRVRALLDKAAGVGIR